MKVTPKLETIAREAASPIILRILKPFTDEDLTYAIENHLNLVKELKGNPHKLARLRMMLSLIPFVSQVAPYVRSKPWLRWFINNELKHNRRDLHLVFLYNPKAFNWLHRNMVNLSKFLFE